MAAAAAEEAVAAVTLVVAAAAKSAGVAKAVVLAEVGEESRGPPYHQRLYHTRCTMPDKPDRPTTHTIQRFRHRAAPHAAESGRAPWTAGYLPASTI